MTLRGRLQKLERNAPKPEPPPPLSAPRRLLNLLEALLSLLDKPGLGRVQDFLNGPAELLRRYVAAGHIGCHVEYQCSGRLNIAYGRAHGLPLKGKVDNPVAEVIKAMDGLEGHLRECMQIDLWRTTDGPEAAAKLAEAWGITA
jgi:hypothetical protein